MLGSLELRRSHFDSAKRYFTRMADVNRAVYGNNHPLVAIALANLGAILLNKKEYVAAERNYREALQQFTNAYAPGNRYIGVAEAGVGKALVFQKRFKEAEMPLLAGYEILAKQSLSQQEALEARSALVKVYEELNLPDRANKFKNN